MLPLKNVLNKGLRRDILYGNVKILTWHISDYEGTMQQRDKNNQGICDALYYAVLAKEYKANRTLCQKGWLHYERKCI